MKTIIFNNFIVNLDDKYEIYNFEATKGSHIHDTVMDIIRYLRIKAKNEEYLLIFNDKKLKISRFSTIKAVAKEYFASNDLNV